MASYSIMLSFLVYIFSSYCIQLFAKEDVGFIAPVGVLTFKKGKYLSSQEGENNFLIPADHRFVVEINIGNPPQVLVFHLDTASYLTWMESTLCVRCFHLDLNLRFDPRKSTTYTESFTKTECLSISHTSIDAYGNCIFDMEYGGRDWTRGNLAKDTLSVIKDQKEPFNLVSLDLPFVFGTSKLFEITRSNYSAIFGIFGLLPMKGSLLDQLKLNKFSHCFSYDTGASNFIYFGNQASLIGSSVPFGSSRNPFYSVALYGVSVNGERLDIPDYYLRTTQEEENLILDSGTAHTWLDGNKIGVGLNADCIWVEDFAPSLYGVIVLIACFYAKVRVEVEASYVIPHFTEVLLPEGKIVTVMVKVPWLPPKFTNCKVFGHSDRFCPKKPAKSAQEWRPVKAPNNATQRTATNMGAISGNLENDATDLIVDISSKSSIKNIVELSENILSKNAVNILVDKNTKDTGVNKELTIEHIEQGIIDVGDTKNELMPEESDVDSKASSEVDVQELEQSLSQYLSRALIRAFEMQWERQ
ncbi:hypothetical protein PTKIN_Ptkin03bG0173800 [Pterospermum kingtungense]